jgi:hypothetical protein
VSVDFGDDVDVAQLRRRGGGKKWVVSLFAVVALCAGAGAVVKTRPAWAQATLNRLGIREPGSQVAAATVAPPPAPVEVPPPAAAPPAPAPQAPVVAPPPAPVPGTDSPLNPHFSNVSDRLTDDQKQHLLEADKKGPGRKGHGASAGHVTSGAPKSKSTTFTTGGSKYDPLNSSI